MAGNKPPATPINSAKIISSTSKGQRRSPALLSHRGRNGQHPPGAPASAVIRPMVAGASFPGLPRPILAVAARVVSPTCCTCARADAKVETTSTAAQSIARSILSPPLRYGPVALITIRRREQGGACRLPQPAERCAHPRLCVAALFPKKRNANCNDDN